MLYYRELWKEGEMDHRELDIYVEKYLNGDSTAFDVIYEETKKSVYLSIYTLTRNKDTIEDLMQDTYMKAIKYFELYQLGTNFKAWISKIARNTTLNYIKKRNREDIVDPLENMPIYEAEANNHDLLDSALKLLDGSEKDIIFYRIILGYKFKEISEILNLPLGTVFWIYQKTIKKLKREL